MRVMIVVTHLLGTGHLGRAVILANAFIDKGHDCIVISGGMPSAHPGTGSIKLVQLPPIRSDGALFTRLLQANGAVVDDHYMARRAQGLRDSFVSCSPDILICELYPFGRRVLAAEFDTLLDAAHSEAKRPVILCSIRDILAPPSKPGKAHRAEKIIQDSFDGVLVHSDPAATPLDMSWPVSESLRKRLIYTGYVAPAPAGTHPERLGAGEILVTAGGGSVGDRFYQTALNAAALDPDRTWRLLIGGADSKERIGHYLRRAPANAVVESARPDFRQMLNHATATVCMCGYNTTMDLLQTQIPAVIVPFDDGSEVEQSLRARSLGQLDGISVIPSAELAADRLLAALSDVAMAPLRDIPRFSFDGAAASVALAERLFLEQTCRQTGHRLHEN